MKRTLTTTLAVLILSMTSSGVALAGGINGAYGTRGNRVTGPTFGPEVSTPAYHQVVRRIGENAQYVFETQAAFLNTHIVIEQMVMLEGDMLAGSGDFSRDQYEKSISQLLEQAQYNVRQIADIAEAGYESALSLSREEGWLRDYMPLQAAQLIAVANQGRALERALNTASIERAIATGDFQESMYGQQSNREVRRISLELRSSLRTLMDDYCEMVRMTNGDER